ncbi:MAG: phenylacetate-CoA oxygenase subunit PaaJ [Cyclobacteriaceae bacterium]|nr:phenylacetate-CoA oxygenase subunit PaaJ [Cyclobacteriaceae bacterium]MCH8514834.1 phenylacetate-CoA oxygenase subunit PaaJ [Cyclobacteriaceae bacterium]
MRDANEIKEWLHAVKDPEIPAISLVDLGVVRKVAIDDTGKVLVDITPTFSGCPALDYMKKDVEDLLASKGIERFEVKVSWDEAWSTNMISEKGRADLKKFGLAPPPKYEKVVDLDILERIECPNCGSENTFMNSPFGPTLCRSIHKCENCGETFEQFKPL